jgi:hypothetical protein
VRIALVKRFGVSMMTCCDISSMQTEGEVTDTVCVVMFCACLRLRVVCAA